jgi:thiol:disulfide interchange protein DsbD
MSARNFAALAVLLCAVAASAAQRVELRSLPAPRGAHAEGALDAGSARLRARLLVDAPAQPGGVWRAGVLFDLDPGWYLYWRHPGDTGLPTRLELATDGEVGPLAWPAPTAFAEEDLVSYGYPDQVLLAAEVRPARPGAPLRARADVLVCESQCLPAHFELERALVPEPDAAARARIAALFDAAAASVPRMAAESDVAVEARWHAVPRAEGEPLDAELRVTRCGPDRAACAGATPAGAVPLFVFEPAQWLVRATAAGVGDGDALAIRLAGQALPGSDPDARELRGVLALRGADGVARPVEIALPLPELHAAEAPPAAPASSLGAWLRALLFGFAGGMVLNLMPCVLPVLALKGVALAELSQRSRREVFGHALAYSAGIQLSLGALALCVLALRASGHAVGWGFQLQEPLFVAAIAVLLVTFATNLFGAFEISFAPDRLARVGADAHGSARSFFDGLLAVVLATPCSAPFLGTAVGFAFASPAPICIAIFAAIGLGLAAPFVAFALWPGLARRMPRGGTWMLELRRALAFALLLTVVWLLWITGRQSGVDAAAGLSALLLAVAGTGWLYGLAQRARGHLHPGVLLGAIAALALAGSGTIELRPAPPAASHEAAPFERAALEAALAEGRPAFVYFTADWCLTCKLNERRVLDTPRAQAELARHGYAVFRADWTRRDAVIAAELAKLGRAGVPVYALYPPGADAPRLLPDLLSPDGFDAALREAASADARVASTRAADALR